MNLQLGETATRTSLSKVPEASVDTVGMGVAAPVVMAVLALLAVAVVAAVEAAVVVPLVDMEVLVVPVEPYEDSKEMKRWQARNEAVYAHKRVVSGGIVVTPPRRR
ncbi:hypothetical protein BBJ29_007894 [Phytophthora kernoviae]|uniref:Uncharacterized protein n=1 Tax=Phytophthora kernoviae TaxID=325452 RepID=A0A3F2RV28_9STRA|nr:hypothetical protein BBJ29_007894 [Phytophthora kernoviae]RLN63769.1 hypothetical protein BBP00_00003885 [Phytophthora kernoviae]